MNSNLAQSTQTAFIQNYYPKDQVDISGQWRASLALQFSQTEQGSRLSAIKRQGPLAVQKAFYPEGKDCAHVYLLHPPAGIVSGDSLSLHTQVGSKAHALLTTPGANRFYRARTTHNAAFDQQKQCFEFVIDAHAMVENLPQETLIYNGANAINQVDVRLTSSSVYIGWDIICLGLTASQQPFDTGQFTQLNRVFCDNKLIFHDRIHITADNGLLDNPIGLAGNTVFGNLIAYAPALTACSQTRQSTIDAIRQQLIDNHQQQWVSVTDIEGLIICRYLGQQSHIAKKIFNQIWQILRPVCCEKVSNEPRIWLT